MIEAIKLAIEKGEYVEGCYVDETAKPQHGDIVICEKDSYAAYDFKFTDVVLDPEFWKALEKACNWGDSDVWQKNIQLPYWRLNAMSYFDCKLTDGDEASFWMNLIKDSSLRK